MDQDRQEHNPQTNLRSPEIENNHELIHRSKYLLWSLQFVVSLSVLSLFISYLTGISLYYSYTYYFSSFLPLLTRTLERKYIFLLCNGIILLFLVGFQGLHDHHHHHYHGFDVDITVNYEHLDDYGLDTIKTSLETDVGVLEDQWHDIRESSSLEDEVEEEEEGSGSNFMAEAEDLNKEENEEVEEGEKEEEEGRRDGEDEKELVSSISSCTDDELNKKFDEFIRKMKEELRLEAKEYQLIPA